MVNWYKDTYNAIEELDDCLLFYGKGDPSEDMDNIQVLYKAQDAVARQFGYKDGEYNVVELYDRINKFLINKDLDEDHGHYDMD